MYERFTDRARRVMELANQEAGLFCRECLDTEHLLLGLIKERTGVAAHVLKHLGLNFRKARAEVEKLVPMGPKIIMEKLRQTPRLNRAIGYSIEEARKLDHSYVGTEHLLLGLVRLCQSQVIEPECIARHVLLNSVIELGDIRKAILNLLEINSGVEADEDDDEEVEKPDVFTAYRFELTDTPGENIDRSVEEHLRMRLALSEDHDIVEVIVMTTPKTKPK